MVPDATSENDPLCTTDCNINTSESLDTSHIEQSIQSTIAQFGMTYDYSERQITISEISSVYAVSISGVWTPETPQYMMITEDIERTSGTEVEGESTNCRIFRSIHETIPFQRSSSFCKKKME